MSDIDNSNPSAQWSEADGNNTAPAPDGFPQAGSPAQDLWIDVPANGRALMGAIKRFWDRINGTVNTTGSAGAYIYTPANNAFPLDYIQGETYTFRASFTSVGNDTLTVNANSLAPKPLYKTAPIGLVQIAAGDIQNGQIVQAVYDSNLGSAGGFQLVGGVSSAASQAIPADAGILTYFGTTSIVFSPRNGSYIKINGVFYTIPSTGLSIANTGVEVNGTGSSSLANSTCYDVYLKVVSVSGVLTLTPSFYTDSGGGTHMTDTTAGNVGVEVRNNGGTPDSTRTLIGKVLTNGSGQFQGYSSAHVIGVLSWFNRVQKATIVAGNFTISNTAPLAEISTSGRANFITWGEEACWGIADGNWTASNGSTTEVSMGIDGTGYDAVVQNAALSGSTLPYSVSWRGPLTEGFHTASLFGFAGAGTTTITVYNKVFVTG
jgi:hypothetical protein